MLTWDHAKSSRAKTTERCKVDVASSSGFRGRMFNSWSVTSVLSRWLGVISLSYGQKSSLQMKWCKRTILCGIDTRGNKSWGRCCAEGAGPPGGWGGDRGGGERKRRLFCSSKLVSWIGENATGMAVTSRDHGGELGVMGGGHKNAEFCVRILWNYSRTSMAMSLAEFGRFWIVFIALIRCVIPWRSVAKEPLEWKGPNLLAHGGWNA